MGLLTIVVVALVAAIAVVYQTIISPFVEMIGFYHQIEPLNNKQCRVVPELEGCESNVLPFGFSTLN